MKVKINTHKIKCFKSNKLLISKKLSIQTFGNVSQRINKDFFVIKPSGVNLNKIKSKDMVVVNIANGKNVSSELKPSSDTETHRVLYKEYPNIKGIAHAHTTFLTAWAQAGKKIPILGTTHADYWKSDIPITKNLKKNKIKKNYELNTGLSIIEILNKKKYGTDKCPGVLSRFHGAFSWGSSCEDALKNLELMEFVAKIALYTLVLGKKGKISKDQIFKHFFRKHGSKRYYGQ
jgi:L-ribulose-5-phosphate 4-epimerase